MRVMDGVGVQPRREIDYSALQSHSPVKIQILHTPAFKTFVVAADLMEYLRLHAAEATCGPALIRKGTLDKYSAQRLK